MIWPGANVILISIDTLRADRLGCYGYSRRTTPQLDELAKRSFLFERAYAHSSNTIVSHASMLTSLHPVTHGSRPDLPLDLSFTTVAEAFCAGGYQTAGFTTHPPWLNRKMGFAQGFEYFVTKDQPAKGLNRDILYWLHSRKLQAPDGRENPFFLFIHYYDVHSDWREFPYETRTRFDRMFTGDYRGEFRGCRNGKCGSQLLLEIHKGAAQLSQEELEWVKALYDGGIAYTDHQIGRLLDILRDLDYFDSSWIVVTGDHGEEFMEHGKVLHTQPYEETARVPLIIKPPYRQTSRSITDAIGLVDLMPTLLEGTGIEPSAEVQGRSLLPLMMDESKPEAAVYFNELGDPGNVTLRHGNYTLVTRNEFTELELYENELNLEQKNNVSDRYPEISQRLRDMARRFHQHQVALSRSRDVEPVNLTEEEIEQLRRLGYVAK